MDNVNNLNSPSPPESSRAVANVGSEARPAIVTATCVLLTPDPGLRQQLARLLNQDYGCTTREMSWDDDPQATVDEDASLFVDLRQLDSNDESGRLARLKAARAALTVTLSDEEEAPEWFETDGRHVHLQLPLAAPRLAKLLRQDVTQTLLEDGPYVQHVVDFEGFKYTTYCEDFYETLLNLRKVAEHDVTILLVGETGTGKTTIARLVHQLSSRAENPLVTVACGALPAELVESELFGHTKGAFTSADKAKIGKFAAAGKGTLLLDEIDVLGLHQQARLLRVIESGEFEPVGSNDTQISQARILVATNVDLNGLMSRNEFRSDLYYRLSVLEFDIPPLRERRQDIVPLTLEYVVEFSQAHGIPIRRIHPDFLQCVVNHDWLGNLRELKNHIRRSVLFAQNEELTSADLTAHVQQAIAKGTTTAQKAETLAEMVAENEQELLERALEANDYKRTATANALGISRVGLYKKMRKYGMLEKRPKSKAAS